MKDGFIKILFASVTWRFRFTVRGTFQNIDFESANPVSAGPPVFVTAASALPGWTINDWRSTKQTEITENNFSTGAPAVILEGVGSVSPPIDGNYSVLLSGSFSTAAISQTGLIPSGTESLMFEAEKRFRRIWKRQSGCFDRNRGDPLCAACRLAKLYALWSEHFCLGRRHRAVLTFSALTTASGENEWTIDDIAFSPQAVPEPSTAGVDRNRRALVCSASPDYADFVIRLRGWVGRSMNSG